MADQITLEQALELVEFEYVESGWRVEHVKGDVWGDVLGDVRSNVQGNVCGNVQGDVWNDVWGDVHGNVQGDVRGDVWGTICRLEWQFVETPIERLRRLIEVNADRAQLLETLKQLEESNG